MAKLNGKKVAILVANGFEQSEMVEPRKALDEAGARECAERLVKGIFRN